jgi:hypothetical protein
MTKAVSPPPHSYLSSIRELTSADAEESLRKKREQQVALAEALKSQIEDKAKRNAKVATKTRFTFREQEHTSRIAGVGSQDLVSVLTVTPESPKSKPKASRKQLFTKADLSQFDIFTKNAYAPRQIPISTDSPFANSKFPTPPQGFSLRSISALEPTVSRLQTGDRNGLYEAKKKTEAIPNPEARSKSVMVNYSEMFTKSKLGAESELIYPDGHISPLPSARCN